VTASATKNGTSDTGASGHTPLVQGLKNDRPEDSRSCPHECHGSLSLTDEDIPICQSCRCTPDGVYLPTSMDTTANKAWRSGSRGENPYPSRGEDAPPRYDNSDLVVLPGGHEEVYDEDDENRPNGVIDEYTWDLSTL